MQAVIRRVGLAVSAGLLLLQAAHATIVPAVSFEELADSSELVVAGRVTRSWAAWDGDHKYIWTHYELAVASAQKGNPGPTVEFAEPGGALDGRVQSIAGTVSYAPGDNVAVFLARMPNGYLRTTGWSQGKFTVDAANRIHPTASAGAEVMDAKGPLKTGTPLRSIDGMTLNELKSRLTGRSR